MTHILLYVKQTFSGVFTESCRHSSNVLLISLPPFGVLCIFWEWTLGLVKHSNILDPPKKWDSFPIMFPTKVKPKIWWLFFGLFLPMLPSRSFFYSRGFMGTLHFRKERLVSIPNPERHGRAGGRRTKHLTSTWRKNRKISRCRNSNRSSDHQKGNQRWRY